MVFYYTSSDGHVIYMGKDKVENEELIKYGFPNDVWFHADDFSSAHVYLRLEKNENWENIAESLLEECCQLTKANSIEGCKQEKIKIVYTPWSNLQKSHNMEVGQVGFKSMQLRKFVHNVQKNKEIIKKLEKTEKEEYPNLELQRETYLCNIKKEEHEEFKKKLKAEQEVQKKQKEEAQAKKNAYKEFSDQSKMQSNKQSKFEDDDFI